MKVMVMVIRGLRQGPRLMLAGFAAILLCAGCGNPAGPDDDSAPDPDPVSTFHRDDLEPQGNVTETPNGYTVEGQLAVNTESGEKIVFLNADLTVEFNQDGTLKSISGTVQIPSPANFIEFANPVQADVGYFSGKFLNENRDFDIVLKENTGYFVFNIAVAIEMRLGTRDDSTATKPFSIKPPVGGHIRYIADFNDPMFYFSAAQDVLGSFCFGASLQGRIPYIPLQPVAQFEPFDGKSIRCGSFTVFKVIEVGGTMVRNVDFDLQLVESDPLGSSFSAGYQAGLNGAFDLSIPIRSFISFGIPLGEASGAITTEVGTEGVVARAFVNGLAAPDNSWWPDFIPVKPAGQLRTSGFVQEDATFDLDLTGEFGVELPSTTERLAGAARASNEEFTLEGTVEHDNLSWAASTAFRKDETELTAKPPSELLGDLEARVEAQIDSVFAEVERALQELEDATAAYEFELSLRGLRSALPVITDEARSRLSAGISSAETSARNQIKNELDNNGLKLCSDNLHSVLTNAAAPYFAAIDRLRAAAEETRDNDQTRAEIEAALRDLASRKRFQVTVTFTIRVASKIIGCGVSSTHTRSVAIDRQVLTDEQAGQLLQAADNVKFIPEASNRMIRAQGIVEHLPTQEQLEQLRSDVQSGVKQIPTLDEVGFVYTYSSQSYDFFVGLDGARHNVAEFDLFNGDGAAGAIVTVISQ